MSASCPSHELGAQGFEQRAYRVEVDVHRKSRVGGYDTDARAIGIELDGQPVEPAQVLRHAVEGQVLQPRFEFTYGLAAQNSTKRHGKPAHFSEFRPFAFQRVDLRRLSARQQSARLDAQRRGDDRRDRSPGRRVDGLRSRRG